MRSKWARQPKHGTIYSNESWEGDRRRTSVQLGQTGDAPVSPDLIVWADPDRRVVVGQQVIMPDAPQQAMAESLRNAIANPAPGSGPPRQPRRIRVRKAEIADALRPVADSLGIRLEVTDSLPFVDELFRSFEVQFGSPSNQGYLDASEVPAPLLAELFGAGASYYKAKPWKLLTEGEPVLLECPDWTPPYRYCVALGASGEVKGMALYESLQDIAHLSDLPADDPQTEERVEQVSAMALLYIAVKELGPRRIEEARAHGWALASRNAYPLIAGTGPGRESHWPTPSESREMTAALHILPLFARALARANGAARVLPVRLRDAERSARERRGAVPVSRAEADSESFHSLFFARTFVTTIGGSEVEVHATYPAPRNVGR